jgi:hypothetical protein
MAYIIRNKTMRENKIQEGLFKKTYSSEKDIYNEDGVDITLIRWMLSMTPTERLQTLQQNVRSIVKLRNAKSHT